MIDRRLGRRGVLALLGAAGVTGLAGCTGDSGEPQTDDGDGTETDDGNGDEETEPQADLSVESTLQTALVTVGEEFTVSVVISNTGDAPGSIDLVLETDDDRQLARETIDVPPNEDIELTLVGDPVADPGEYTLILDGQAIGELEVEERRAHYVLESTIAQESVAVGDRTDVEITVTNDGNAADATEIEVVFGEADVITESVSVPPGEKTTLALSHVFEETGEFPVTVDGSTLGTVTVEERSVYFVDPDGDDDAIGAESSPLGTIDEGLARAYPGDTIQVAPGRYYEELATRRSGEPDNPITITGPSEAICGPHEHTNAVFDVAHSHIHLKGITMHGLKDADREYETREAYAVGIVQISPHRTHLDDDLESVDYLEDVVIEPAAMGHCQGNMIFITRLHGGSIGGFELIGPAGMNFHPEIEDPLESHVGEIIYAGTSLDDLDRRYPWDTLDRTQDLRIHNIDNSAGYHHSQFIDLKIGTENITIENCTDRGSGSTTDGVDAAAIEVKGNDHTIRWNDLGDCLWGFIFGAWVPDGHEHHADGENWARDNEIYGNFIHGFAEDAFMFYEERTEGGSGPVSPDDQRILCGNEIEGADGRYEYATTECEVDLPEADGIGAGGD